MTKNFFTNELKVLDKQTKREYSKHGKSRKIFILKSKFDLLYFKASKNYLRNNVEMLLNTQPGKASKKRDCFFCI